jgi:protein-disulfide isomerase
MMKSQLDASLQQMGSNTAPSQNPTTKPSQDTASTSPKGTLTQTQVQALKKDAFVKGNPSAKITVIEYSDFQCPYCQRFHSDGVLDQLVKNYPQDVNVVFKNFVVHEGAQKAAEALLCIGSLKNTDTYYDAIAKIFALSDLSVDSLDTLAQ